MTTRTERPIDPSNLDHATLTALIAQGRRARSAAAHGVLARLLSRLPGARRDRRATPGVPVGA